jgi:hypothetical protein
MHVWNDNRWSSGQFIRTIEFKTIKSNDDDEVVYDIQMNCCVSKIFGDFIICFFLVLIHFFS